MAGRLRPGRLWWIRVAAAILIGVGFSTLSWAGDVCVIATGLGGLPEYEENFVKWGDALETVFKERLGDRLVRLDGRTVGRKEMVAALSEAAGKLSGSDQFWLFLIGHANYDGERFKFQIKGPDLTDADLAGVLQGLGDHQVNLVAATSSSGTLLPEMAGENRVIVTATKNALEKQPPLFLSFFLEAASSAEADTDKNGRVSLLEAFLFSRTKVASWFEERGRLQTEHPLLDDRGRVRIGLEKDDPKEILSTGEGLLSAAVALSAPPERAYRSAEAKALVLDKQGVEREIEDLKFRKSEMATEVYYLKLQELLVRLATINEKIEQSEQSEGNQ